MMWREGGRDPTYVCFLDATAFDGGFRERGPNRAWAGGAAGPGQEAVDPRGLTAGGVSGQENDPFIGQDVESQGVFTEEQFGGPPA